MATENVSTMVNRLNSAVVVERQAAAEQLSRLGEGATAAAVPLARACSDEDESVREWAAAALEGLGPPDAGDLPALLELIDAPQADTVYWSVTLIGRLGPAASPAVARLAHAVSNHAAIAVRQRAAWALGHIGTAAIPARAALERALLSDDPRLAALARRSLEQIAGGP